ncbi:MAG: hypothetical protein AB7V46_22650 [Thermomicrobiales bacterium]
MRQFKVIAPGKPWDGVVAEAPQDASEDEIARAVFDAVAEYVDYHYEEITEDA